MAYFFKALDKFMLLIQYAYNIFNIMTHKTQSEPNISGMYNTMHWLSVRVCMCVCVCVYTCICIICVYVLYKYIFLCVFYYLYVCVWGGEGTGSLAVLSNTVIGSMSIEFMQYS